jgi:hypothetical protein
MTIPEMLKDAAMLLGEIRLLADVRQAPLSMADRDTLRRAQVELARMRQRVTALSPDTL